MESPQQHASIFIKAIFAHTIQVVGGTLFAVSGFVWGFLGWIYPTLALPGFQTWILATIAVFFYFVGAFKAWEDLYTNLRAAESKFTELVASSPQPRITLQFREDSMIQGKEDVLLEVTNDGQQAEFWARISVTGAWDEHGNPLDMNARAVWDETNQTSQRIPKGATFSLRLAFSRAFNSGGPDEESYWTFIGQSDDGDSLHLGSGLWAPRLGKEPKYTLEVVLMSDPDTISGALKKRFALEGTDVTDEDDREAFRNRTGLHA